MMKHRLFISVTLTVVITSILIIRGQSAPTCSSTDFYCPYDSAHKCKPRSVRCLLESERTNENCLNPKTGSEDGCYGDLKSGIFDIMDGWRPLDFLQRTANRSYQRLEHEFVTFRGFTYEYGPDGVTILDTSDPDYEYSSKNGRVTEFTKFGTSMCRTEELSPFLRNWGGEDFDLYTHNCQHFAHRLMMFLEGNCKPSISIDSVVREKVNVGGHAINPVSQNFSAWSLQEAHNRKESDGSLNSVIVSGQVPTRSMTAHANLLDQDMTQSGETHGHAFKNAYISVLAGLAVVTLTAVIVVSIAFLLKGSRTEESEALLGNP